MLSIYTRQIMFYQLGYYTGKIDGIWGKGCKAATKQFQKDYGLVQDSIYGTKTEKKLKSVYKKFMNGNMTSEDWKKIKYFKESEIDCNCGCGYKKISKQQIFNLDTLRYYLETSMSVTSGCRCKKHNAKSGGKVGSRHYYYGTGAKACDFTSKATDTLAKRKKVINFWIKYMPNSRYGYCDGFYNNQGKTGKVVYKGMGKAIHLDTK